MIQIKEVHENKAQICEQILRALPDWFGIEKAILDYIEDVKKMPMLCACDGETTVGFISLNIHNDSTAEIHVMGLLPEYHRKGIGRDLVLQSEEFLSKKNLKFISVKTLSPSREDPFYKRTRLFYSYIGFQPLEEFKTLWGEENPCLMMIKPLTPKPHTTAFDGFTKQEGSSFWFKDGPAKENGIFCNKKLCFAASDLGFLIRLLNWLHSHEDCFFVKFSEKTRDGVFLARCFFSNEKKVGEIWRRFKLHPKVHCNIQDDDFTKELRDRASRWENKNLYEFD